MDNSIVIRSDEHGFVSRHHATIESSERFTDWLVRDGQWNRDERQWQESKNGTYVNSIPVSRNGYYLRPGDIVSIGDVTIRFEKY